MEATANMKTSLFLPTEVYASIESPPIPMINKEVKIKDKNIIKIKLWRSMNITTSKTCAFEMGIFDSGPSEEIL